MAAYDEDAVGGDELLEVSVLSLRVSTLMLILAAEYVPTLDRNDVSYSKRMTGLTQMRDSSARTFEACLDSLGTTTDYTWAQCKRMVSHLIEISPDLIPYLTAEDRKELTARLAADCQARALAHMKSELEKLLAIVKAAPNKSSTFK